jgi:GDP-D-mannose dehydratase
MGWKPEVSFGELVQRMVEADLRSLEAIAAGS